MSLLATDGSLNITVVDGTSYVGNYASDGSLNVFVAPGDSYVGLKHASGATNVTVAPGDFVPVYAPDGSLYVNEDTTTRNEGTIVTVVSGTLVVEE